MPTITIFAKRHLRICYWDAENQLYGAHKAALESKLSLMGDTKFVGLKSLDDASFDPCDLLIIAADKIPEDAFPKWIEQLHKRVKANYQIWTPALILADLSFATLDAILTSAVKSNWYFDIISINHLDSLPIRVANLLRIHDHLHELRRYHQELDRLSERVVKMEAEIEHLKSR